MESKYIDVMNDLIEEDSEVLTHEFEDIEDPTKPFRFEYAHEGLTESNSRFKEWRTQ